MTKLTDTETKSKYVVSQVVLKRRLFRSKLKRIERLESVINYQELKGYELDSIVTTHMKVRKVHYTLVFKLINK